MAGYERKQLDNALSLLSKRLELNRAPAFSVVVCGGSALLALGLVTRTTRDVDVVALWDEGQGGVLDPAPFPETLERAARDVANELGLKEDWINNGPSRGDGGLYRLGLPEGLAGRLTRRVYGRRLIVYFVSRYDQIHFKLFAAIDQGGGRHMSDLEVLKPTDEELLAAARWSVLLDPSEGYRGDLERFLRWYGHGHLVGSI